MSKQLHQRIALPLLRHVLETFNAGAMTSEQACSELCLSRSRLFAIRKEWLSAIRRGEDWKPSGSGGAHKAPWTDVKSLTESELLQMMLEAKIGDDKYSVDSEHNRALGNYFRARDEIKRRASEGQS